VREISNYNLRPATDFRAKHEAPFVEYRLLREEAADTTRISTARPRARSIDAVTTAHCRL
jgi:hypothetical protein